jgi:hypothetical protein
MKAKRLRVIVLVLLGLLLLIVAIRYLPSGEPTYEGKSSQCLVQGIRLGPEHRFCVASDSGHARHHA